MCLVFVLALLTHVAPHQIDETAHGELGSQPGFIIMRRVPTMQREVI